MVLFGSSGRNARLIGTALLITTFVAGALAGAAAARVATADDKPAAVKPTGHPGAAMRGGPRRLLLDEQFTRELGLTDAQRAEIRKILDRRDIEAKQMWQTFEPRLKAFAESTHDEIEKILTKEQAEKLNTAIEQRRASWKKGKYCPDDSAKS